MKDIPIEKYFVMSLFSYYKEALKDHPNDPYSVFMASICYSLAQLNPGHRNNFFSDIADIQKTLSDSIFEDEQDLIEGLIEIMKESNSN